MRSKKDFITDSLHIFILVSLAFAQPMYVISKYAEFFATRHSHPVDIIFLVLTVFVLIPSFCILLELIAGRFRKIVHCTLVAGLLSIIALILLKKNLSMLPGTVLFTASVIIGILVTAAYIRIQEVRRYVTILLPAIFIFPYLFVFSTPVKKVVFPEKKPSVQQYEVFQGIETEKLPPIVMVVFDEFSITSLMNKERKIDRVRYPNFAGLAEDSIWFRNATTVSESTVFAVPAILSGSYVKEGSIPTVNDYPDNIFTLLNGAYDMEVFESHTMLCPENICEREQVDFIPRFRSMMLDLLFVYLHIILPIDLTDRLPVVSQTWKNFAGDRGPSEFSPGMADVIEKARASYNDRPGLFKEFVESISYSDRPALYFLHIMLPHVPWEYLPSGRIYTENGMDIPGLNIRGGEKWDDNKWLVIQGYQRHLLQVGFVDRLLGTLLEKLKRLDLYDRSLIIITTDHGVSFSPDGYRRPVNKVNYKDIMPVPLFIKTPGQSRGITSDRNVESIDILPTVADILNIQLPWVVDGKTALDTSLPEKKEKVIYYKQARDRMVFDSADLELKYSSLEQMIDLFGSGDDPGGLFRVGPRRELVGRSAEEERIIENPDIEARLDQTEYFADLDRKSKFVPAQITGQIFMDTNPQEPLDIVISVNGLIQASMQTYETADKEIRFSAFVPETSFRNGKNDVEVLIVEEENNEIQLVRARDISSVTYSLVSSELILSSEGESFEVVPDALSGSVDNARVENRNLILLGWAADIKNSEAPHAVLVFINGEFLKAGKCNMDRPDVVNAFKNQKLLHTGFRYALPVKKIKDADDAEIRIFAVSERGVASEITRNKKKHAKNKYLLVESGDKDEIVAPSGDSFPVLKKALRGSLQSVKITEDSVLVNGWAVDLINSEIPEAIIIFIDGMFFYKGTFNSERSDVEKVFQNKGLRKSGFQYRFPLEMFNNTEPVEVRFFAISKQNLASELKYPPDFRWSKKS
jgi:hypothetical protein